MHQGPNIEIMTGFGDTSDMMQEYTDALEKKLRPNSCQVTFSVPRDQSHLHPEEILGPACERIERSEKTIGLDGYSVGGLYALVTACRTRFRNVSHLFLIEAPLRSDIAVPSISYFQEFHLHYEYRTTLARECEDYLARNDHPPIIAIGSQTDGIVPPAAKFLNGSRSDTFELEMDEDVTFIPFQEGRDMNVILPFSHKGHSLRGKKVELVTDIQKAAYYSLPRS